MFIKKVLKIGGTILKGAIKPLPLSGVVEEFKKAKTEKDWTKFVPYILAGIMLYLLATGVITFAQLKELIKIIL